MPNQTTTETPTPQIAEGDKPKYPFSSNRGGVQYLKLHQQYNCLILFQNGGSGKQIMKWINDQYEHITHKEVVGSPQSIPSVF